MDARREQFSAALSGSPTPPSSSVLPARAAWLFLGVLWLSVLGCRDKDQQEAPASTEKDEPKLRPLARPSSTLRLLERASSSDLHHGGLVLELGEPKAEGAGDFILEPAPTGGPGDSGTSAAGTPFQRVTHAGATYIRLDQRRATFSFWVGSPLTVSSISALLRAGESDRAVFSIDDKRLGTLRAKADAEVISLKTREFTLEPGPHRLAFELPGRADRARSFDISWVRLGTQAKTDDLPPARRDVIREVEIGGDQRPAVVLRAGGAWRVPVWIPEGARLSTAIGVWGAGASTAEIAVVRGAERRIVSTVSTERKDEEARWQPVEVDLSAYAGRSIEIELGAAIVNDGARLAFADPKIALRDLEGGFVPRARRAIVIVLSGLGRDHRPATLVDAGLPAVAAFARTATSYPEYRSPTTSPLGVVASLLTGLEPWQHGLAEDTDRLPQSRPTFAETLAAGGGDAGLFTGVPLSFEGFGLQRGFERYVSISPTEDRAATDPIDEAQSWLSEHQGHTGPLLSVIHLRAAHPPFDIDRDRARSLPPKEYGGDLDARRAAIQLSEIRARRPTSRQQMPEEDWKRLDALRRTSLLDLDARLARFLTWLTTSFPDDGSLVVIMGDVPAGERPHIPYETHPPLTEEYLRTLLLVRHPGGHLAARSMPGLFTVTDLAGTLAHSLEVDLASAPSAFIDLGHPDATQGAARRMHIAYRDGSFSALLGGMLLFGKPGARPALCDLRLDANCVENRAERDPTLFRTMWSTFERRVGPELLRRPPPETREPDEYLDHALVVWGVER